MDGSISSLSFIGQWAKEEIKRTKVTRMQLNEFDITKTPIQRVECLAFTHRVISM
jgi:hypothetical protein